jgi:hypothetical protein
VGRQLIKTCLLFFFKKRAYFFIVLIKKMELNIKDPVMIAKIMVAMSVGIVLSYIIISYAYQDLTRCDVICRLNKNIIENSVSENVIGKRSVANLNLAEEEEIKSIIKKVFENQWNYYNCENEMTLDRLYIKELYIIEEHQNIKEELKKNLAVNYNDSGTTNQYGYKNYNADDISRFIGEIQFSKPIEYESLNGRTGIFAGFNDNRSRKIDFHYFLFKKIGNQWKIEREKIAITSPYELTDAEAYIIKEILQKEKK